MKFLLFLAAIASVVAGFVLVGGLMSSSSAPQQAAVAACAVAIAVIPYVFARAAQLWQQADDRAEQHKELLAAVRRLQDEQKSS